MIRKAAAALSVVALFVVLGACGSETQHNESAQASQQQGSAEDGGQLTNIGRQADVAFNGSSYISPFTETFGDVYIGQNNFVGPSSVIRAAPGNRVELGDEATVQDNIIVHALNESVVIGDQSNLGHHAIVRDSRLGDDVYVGYNTEIDDSQVGSGSLIYHGARVEGVEIPENSYVASGEVVADQATADELPTTEEAGVDEYYQEALLDIHRELTHGYIDLYEAEGFDSVIDVGVNPKTSWNQEQVEPQIGESAQLDEFVRIVGDVRLGDNSSVGRRTAIRADEGSPIVIGPGAAIDDRVTFHAVKGTDIQIGEFLVVDDDAVLHGPLEMGDGDFVGEDAVVFRARLGNDVRVGEGAIVVGPEASDGEIGLEIPDGTLIPAGAVVTSQKDVEALEKR